MPTANQPLVYVSYARRSDSPDGQAAELSPSDEREAIVNELCWVLDEEDQIVVGRDRKLVKTGDSIVDFARDVARGGLILAVISHKSLRSYWCMVQELLQAFRRRNFSAEEFGSDVLALVLEDALEDFNNLLPLVKYWIEELEQKKAAMELADPDKEGSRESWQDVDQIAELIRKLPDLIRALGIRVMPRGAVAIREKRYGAIRARVLQRLQEKGLADRLSPSRLPPSNEGQAGVLHRTDSEPYYLALTLQLAQAASGESGDFLYSWRMDLKEPVKIDYEPCTISPSSLGPLVRQSREPTPAAVAAAGQAHSSIVDILQVIVDWLPQQTFGLNCVLELFVPLEWLDFGWSTLPLRDNRRRNAPVSCLQALVPYVLRSWERIEDPGYTSARLLLEAKYDRLAGGVGVWLAGADACSSEKLRAAETDHSIVGIKRLRPLESDRERRHEWLENMLLTMAPVALWHLPESTKRPLQRLHAHLNRYGEPLAGHNTGNPVSGDCKRLQALPLQRKAIAGDPVVHDIALLLDHPERAPAAAVDQAPILSF